LNLAAQLQPSELSPAAPPDSRYNLVVLHVEVAVALLGGREDEREAARGEGVGIGRRGRPQRWAARWGGRRRGEGVCGWATTENESSKKDGEKGACFYYGSDFWLGIL